jgi:hypothetical protein
VSPNDYISGLAWRWSRFGLLGLEIPGFVPEILDMDSLPNRLYVRGRDEIAWIDR